ncbi:PREDICTED: FIT family protein CG10671-like [Priapulus caudatus]|uniref:FIT family protein CG10671-like n=1 Tax=Priapulus caudatus TaxID=37621 RepID=A0ABM1DYT4_PRICU|nr:PREDICTED: FIT family protein CG10671-like [Priapulus caudatus]
MSSREGKKTLPKPLGLRGFLVVIVLFFCKKVLFVKPEIKVCVYLVVCLLGSVIGDIFVVPRTYFSRKDNVFNVYFVKLCWGWTGALLAAFIAMTSYVYTCGNRQLVFLHLSRLVVATVVWYVCTSSFVTINTLTGFCITASVAVDTADACRTAGHAWLGFDISGHVFMMAYCALLLAEESRAFAHWDRVGTMLLRGDNDVDERLGHLTGSELARLREAHPRLTPYIKASFLTMALLCLLWDTMLLATTLYFHSVAQKMAALAAAIICWFVTYRLWYKIDVSPGLPGQGAFRYVPDQSLPSRRQRL